MKTFLSVFLCAGLCFVGCSSDDNSDDTSMGGAGGDTSMGGASGEAGETPSKDDLVRAAFEALCERQEGCCGNLWTEWRENEPDADYRATCDASGTDALAQLSRQLDLEYLELDLSKVGPCIEALPAWVMAVGGCGSLTGEGLIPLFESIDGCQGVLTSQLSAGDECGYSVDDSEANWWAECSDGLMCSDASGTAVCEASPADGSGKAGGEACASKSECLSDNCIMDSEDAEAGVCDEWTDSDELNAFCDGPVWWDK